MKRWLAATFVASLAACSPKQADAPAHAATITAVGATLPEGKTTPLADVLAQPERYAGQTLIVEGVVRAACKKRGCWMELSPATGDARSCRVRFKDYGFFVPPDSAGAEARLSGEVKLRMLGKEEVAHLEGEGATVAKSADGSAQAVELTATGVELTRR
jgi:hypothetical protein